jgi:hypothetical protein
MKILIAVSNNRADLNIQFVRCLIELLSYTNSKGHKAGLTFFDSYDAAVMRNDATKAFLLSDADYIFYVDADMIYPYDSIVKLIETGKDVIGGFYVSRKQPILPIHYKEILLDGGMADASNRVPLSTGVVEVGAGGGGGLLVARSVLEKMEVPYFKVIMDEEKKLHVGEDVYFFLKLKELGLKAYVNCDVQFGHIVNGAVYPDGNVKIT